MSSATDRTVRVWDRETALELKRFDLSSPLNSTGLRKDSIDYVHALTWGKDDDSIFGVVRFQGEQKLVLWNFEISSEVFAYDVPEQWKGTFRAHRRVNC